MRKRGVRWAGGRRCGHIWGSVTLIAAAGLFLAVVYPLGLLMLFLGAVIACILFCFLYE
ncbi:MAG: hypothetical protein FWH04_03235 [Oscillospiraceae bacterium]|nr:hypothetical protein [Oscillospiraceae bacterium]